MSASTATAANNEEKGSSMAQAALCIDTSGLCIGSKGTMGMEINESKSGNFAALLSLASRLDTDGNSSPPFVTIETASSAFMIKEYDGNTVVLKVPVHENSGSTTNLKAGA